MWMVVRDRYRGHQEARRSGGVLLRRAYFALILHIRLEMVDLMPFPRSRFRLGQMIS